MGYVERFSEDVEGTAYFAACELLTNAHAGTDGARVRLYSGDWPLVVEDDGQGSSQNGACSGGLANIRDRVEALHGRLTIESRPGAGTSVRAELRWPRCLRSVMSRTLRVVIAEDNYLVREGVRRLLEDWAGRGRGLRRRCARAARCGPAPQPERCSYRYPNATGHHMEGIEAARPSVPSTPGSASCCRSTRMRATPAPCLMTAQQVWRTCSRIGVILKTWSTRSMRWRPGDRSSIR